MDLSLALFGECSLGTFWSQLSVDRSALADRSVRGTAEREREREYKQTDSRGRKIQGEVGNQNIRYIYIHIYIFMEICVLINLPDHSRGCPHLNASGREIYV